MNSGITSVRLLTIGAFLAPLIGLGAARWWNAGALRPASASGSELQVEETRAVRSVRLDTILVPEASPSESQTPPSPFYIAAGPEAKPIIDLPEPERAAGEEAIPEFSLTSIARGTRPMAVINGRLRTVGSDLGEGWSLASIDPDRGSVVVRHAGRGDLTVWLHGRQNSR